MIQPDGEYRHKWRVGDIVIWDNRCSYHRAAGDYPPHEDRIHWRVSIKERVARATGGGMNHASAEAVDLQSRQRAFRKLSATG